MSLRQIGRSAAQDLVLLLEQLDPLVRLPQRVGLATRLWRARRPGRVLLVERQPALQARQRDTEVLGDLGHRGIGLPVDPDHVLAKLLGERLRHDAHPSSADTHRRRSEVTYPCSSPKREGDKYVVNGRKVWISKAVESEKILLLARTQKFDESERKTDGMTLFLTDLDRDRVDIRPIRKMGRNAVTSNE